MERFCCVWRSNGLRESEPGEIVANGTIRLQLVDTGNQPLVDPNVIAEITSLDSSRHFRVQLEANGSANIEIALQNPGMGVYKVTLIPIRYRMVQFFQRVQEGTTTTRAPVMFPVDASKVADIRAPVYGALPDDLRKLLEGAAIQGFGTPKKPKQGADLYAALSAVQKAALLNFYVKAQATVLADGETVFPLLGAPIKLLQDRIFAKVTAHLYEETLVSSNFHQVPFALHQNIPPYQLFDSYKTRDAMGNLQLTFSRNDDAANDYLVDMDIDEAQGLGHLFEVIENAATQTLTSPYDVREILLVAQGLKPLYSFQFPEVGAASIATSA